EPLRPRPERPGALQHQLPDLLAGSARDGGVALLELEHEGLAEQRLRVVLAAPVDGIALARTERRRVTAVDRHEAGVLAPGREADPAARLADAGELGGDRGVVGSEDDPHRRRYDGEARVLARKRLGVADLEVDCHALLLGQPAG